MRELMGVDGCCLWLSTNVDDLCLLCCCGGLTVYTESGHFSRIVSFYPSREKVSSNIPSKRANKLALRVVSHGTQTLSLPPKWQHIHMGAFSYPDERFKILSCLSLIAQGHPPNNGQAKLLCVLCHMPRRRSHCLPKTTHRHGHV